MIKKPDLDSQSAPNANWEKYHHTSLSDEKYKKVIHVNLCLNPFHSTFTQFLIQFNILNCALELMA